MFLNCGQQTCAYITDLKLQTLRLAAFFVFALTSDSNAQQTRVALAHLLAEATVNHPSVLAADAAVRVAQGLRTTARSLPNPMLSYDIENIPWRGSGLGMEREVMTMASFGLHDLYQRWPRTRQAGAEVAAAEAEAVAARRQITMDATQAFYRAGLSELRVATTTDLVLWLDSIVAYNRRRVTEGVAAEADLIRSELELDRARAVRDIETAELRHAQAMLSTFFSTFSQALPLPDTVPFRLPELAAASDSAVLSMQPEVLAAQLRLEARAAAIGHQRTLVIPELDAGIGTKQAGGTTSVLIGARLPFPLLNQNRGEINRAKAERDIALANLSHVRRRAAANINASRSSAALLTVRVEQMSRGFLQRADQLRRITEGAYREGAVSLYQMLDAASAWNEARQTYYATLFAQQESIVRLLSSEGRSMPEIISWIR